VAVLSGGFALGLYRGHGASGFFTTSTQTVGSAGFALTVPDINGQLTEGWQRWGLSQARTTVRVSCTSQLPGPIFVGIAPTGQASEYLSDVTRDRVQSVDLAQGLVRSDHVEGPVIPSPPQEQGFWSAEVAGRGVQTLEWSLREGDWAMVIMNGDAGAPVVADVRLSARFGMLIPTIIGLPLVGLALLAIAAVLFIAAGRRTRSAPMTRTFAPQGLPEDFS